MQLSLQLGAATTSRFGDLYYELNKQIMLNAPVVPSRNGDTRELLNFKTVIRYPGHRCVGGHNRDVNIFFLIAEALWIWAGRRDVAFLDIFNGRMKDYSDNGKYFHAPYGWRMRKFDVNSNDEYDEENNHATQGIDQIREAIKMLAYNDTDRRVVVQIWNANLDLNKNMKDIPCNDLVMFKIRNKELFTTIQNRSNDLHWGLLTNVFQFSFVTEMMCHILALKAGDQVHNSQSLHCYTDLPLTNELLERTKSEFFATESLYGYCDAASYGQFNFSDLFDCEQRLVELDFHINSMILGILRVWNGEDIDEFYYSEQLQKFSPQLKLYWDLLKAYVMYKRSKNKQLFFLSLKKIQDDQELDYDVVVLAINFALNRLTGSGDITMFSKDLNSYFNNGERF